jgi:cation transport ATPase
MLSSLLFTIGAGMLVADAGLLAALNNDLRRLGTCVRLSRRCRRTILINVGLGLGWTVLLVALAAGGTFGANGALVAAILHNVGTPAVMLNAGRLLKFHDIEAGSL